MTFVEGRIFGEEADAEVYSIASADPARKCIHRVDGEDQRAIGNSADISSCWISGSLGAGPCIVTFPRLRSWHKKYADKISS